MSDRAQHLVSIDLAAPETWPHEVWRAFEKASHQRTADNIQENHNRSFVGNQYEHLGAKVVCHNELRPAERIAEHTGRTEFLPRSREGRSARP